MGVYYEYPVDTLIHTSPRWRIKEGYLNQDTGEVYLYAEATSGAGSFSYSYIYVQLVCLYPSGEYTMDYVCGLENPGFGNIYGDFSGTITVDLNAGATECYLAMRCAQYEDTLGGKGCTISSDADHDPGYEIPGTRVKLETVSKPKVGNLRNTNPYNGNQGVSASTSTIDIAWDSIGEDPPDKMYYSFGDYWRPVPNNAYSLHLEGYSPGTSVYINILATNGAGNAEDLPGITVRTRYDNPTVTATVTNRNTTSFTINWQSNVPLKQLDYSVNGGYEIVQLGGQTSGSITITGLAPGTQYPIYVNGTSTDEYDGLGSPTITIYGQTLDSPKISASISANRLEQISFNWSSNMTMKQIKYTISGSTKTANVSGTSGSIIITGLSPNTSYSISISGVSSDDKGGVASNTVSITGKTLDIAKISTIEKITHGTNFRVVITNPSNTSATLKLWTSGNNHRCDISMNVTVGTYTVTVTESKWDDIYKTFPNSNTNTMYAQLTTHGTKDYTDSQKTQTITLTGVQKTCKTGINSQPRRVQVWVGDSNRKPRRCVSWTNVSKIRRTI